MRDGRVSIIGRFWMASFLFLLIPLPDPHPPSPSRQITPVAEQAEPANTPAIDLHQPSAPPEKRTVKVPILVYHHLSQSIPDGSRALRRLTVTAEVFDQQMEYLQDNGYQVITFSALADYLEQGQELPTLPVIISFDDGWETQFEFALPCLEKYHFSATFFIITNYIGRPGFISWPQLQKMRTEGMRIGSHSRSHPHLNKIFSPEILWDQIYNSKSILESQLGSPVEDFAYPYGSYNAAADLMVRLAGYRTARGCCFGVVQSTGDIFTLRAMLAPNELAKFKKYLAVHSAGL